MFTQLYFMLRKFTQSQNIIAFSDYANRFELINNVLVIIFLSSQQTFFISRNYSRENLAQLYDKYLSRQTN